jgi:hypothetical protein
MFLGEVWVGQACARTNEKVLTACGKKWGQEEGEGGGSFIKKRAYAMASERPLVASRSWSSDYWPTTANQSLTAGRQLTGNQRSQASGPRSKGGR